MKKWEMDRGRKPRNGKFEEGLILDQHRIPHIQTGPNLVNKSVVVDTVAYSPRRPALVVKGGAKKYGSTFVLHNLNMFAKEGTIYCLVGASNTGKSTILKCITGQQRLTKGELLVFGSIPGSVSSGIPGRRVGYMQQELGLHTDLSITEVLQYHGRMVGMCLQQIEERINKLSELLDLQHLKTQLHKLSPGLQKRASLACALLHEPELIVLDNPTSGMDILFKKGIWMHLQKLVSNGRTSVIMSTQNLEEAGRQAHRVGVLRNGRLLIEDSPASLLHRHGTQLLSEAMAKLSIKDTIRLKTEGDKKNNKDEVVCMDEWNSPFGIQSSLEESKNSGIISSVSYKEWMEQVGINGEEDQFKLGLQGKDKAGKFIMKKKKDDDIPLPPYPNPSRIGNRFRALLIKQFLQCTRNPGALLVSLLLPLIVITGFCHCIGNTGPLSNIRVGIVNLDSENKNFTYDGCTYVAGCSEKMLTCRFLDTLAGKDSFEFVDFISDAEALQELKRGNISTLITFRSGFGSELYNQVSQERQSDDPSSKQSFSSTKLRVVYDEYNDIFLRRFLSDKMIHALNTLGQELEQDCIHKTQEENDDEEESSTISIDPEALISSGNDTTKMKPGHPSPGYPEFYIPGGMILVAFFTPLFASGGYLFFQERKLGILNRASVSGTSNWESLLTHLLFQLPGLLGSTAILVLVPIFLFGVEINLCLIWEVILLLVLTGFLGVSLSNKKANIIKTLYSFVGTCVLVISWLLSGLFWPIKTQYWILQWVTHYLPLTLPAQSLQSIIVREWDLLELESGVWQGFSVLSAYIGLIWLLLVLVLVTRYLRR